MKATLATGEFEPVVIDGSPVMWVTKVESASRRAPVTDNANYAPARGILSAVVLGSLLWLFVGAAVWFLI